MRDKGSREDFRSIWQDTRLKCARTDEMEILRRLEDDDEVWKHGIRWAPMYIYIFFLYAGTNYVHIAVIYTVIWKNYRIYCDSGHLYFFK